MKDQEINLLVRFLAGEEISPLDKETVGQLKELYPKESKEIEQAFQANIFSSIHFDGNAAFDKIRYKIQNEDTKNKIPLYNQNWFQVAASFIILFGTALGILFFASWNVELTNQSANLMYLELPDGSDLTLDKNATIKYKTGFLNQFNRQVEMSGRVEYQVCKQGGKKFIVHTKENSVTVLGTVFTINEEHNQTQIVLNEGKIRLNGSDVIDEIILDQLGHQIIFNENEIIKNNIVSSQLYSSWTNRKLRFSNCSVEEILGFLSDTYQVDVTISDSSLLENQIYGSAPSDDPYLIINALSKILNTDLKTTK